MKKLFFILPLIFFMLSTSKAYAKEIRLDVTEDSYIDSIEFYDIHVTSTRLLLGFGDTTRNGITQIYLKYDNGPLIDERITPDQIESVTLHMYQYRNKYGTDYDIHVGEPESFWDAATINWLTQPTTTPNTYPKQKISSLLDWKEIDVTDLVIKQLQSFENSYGIVLYMDDPYSTGGVFWSKECQIPDGYFCSEPLQPYITITTKEDLNIELKLPYSQQKLDKNEATFEWDFSKAEELYKLEISDDSNFTDILYSSNWMPEKSYTIDSLKNGKYYWRVCTYFSKITSPIRSFLVDTPTPAITQEKENEEDIPIVSTENNQEKVGEVKGVATVSQQKQLGYCKYRYNQTTGEVRRVRCKLEQPIIPRLDHIATKDGSYWLDTTVKIPEKYDLFIETTICKPRTIWDPRSWFGCSETSIATESETVDIRGSIWALVQGRKIDGYAQNLGGGKYKINFPLSDDLASNRFIIRYDTSFTKQLGDSSWLDLFEFSPKSNSVTIPKVKVTNADLTPYRFPFENIIGVTQWYGDTEYQHPHTGIDFGAKLEAVYAAADGIIAYAGWDKGKNSCLSGGNYVLIKHKDGKHTIYLHLKNYKNEKGKAWKTGDKIYKGQRVGISGNTGSYNCEPLGYHLHFETRNSKSYLSHTNPVPLVNVDWSLIPTLQASKYPGRLTGNNPHPGK